MLARVLHDSANQKSGRPSAGGCNWASQSNGVSKALGCGVKRCTRPGAPSAVCSRAPRWITPRCRASRRRDEPNGVRLWGLGLANVLNDPSGTRRAVAGSVTASASSLHSLRSLRSGGVRPRRRRPVCEVSHTKWRSWNPRHRPRSLRSRRGDRRNLARRGPRSAHRLPEQPNGVR